MKLIKYSLLFLLLCALFYGCRGNPQVHTSYYYPGARPFDAMPSEGWATDPILSYDLFSYYPVNYYNTGLYNRFGPYGIYYH